MIMQQKCLQYLNRTGRSCCQVAHNQYTKIVQVGLTIDSKGQDCPVVLVEDIGNSPLMELHTQQITPIHCCRTKLKSLRSGTWTCVCDNLPENQRNPCSRISPAYHRRLRHPARMIGWVKPSESFVDLSPPNFWKHSLLFHPASLKPSYWTSFTGWGMGPVALICNG